MQERVYYPLTSSQTVMFMNLKYATKKQCNNICSRIDMKHDIEEKVFLQALTIAAMRYPSMNCRFTKKPGDPKTIVQYFVDKIPENIELLDMSHLTEAQIDEQLEKFSAIPFPNGCYDVQMYSIKLILMPNGFYTIYLCINHLIMDAYAIMAYIKFTNDIYESILNKQPLPEIRSTAIEYIESDVAYSSSKKHEDDVKWWTDFCKAKMKFTSLNGKGSKEFCKGKDYGVSLRLWQTNSGMVDRRIPKELVDKVQKFAMNKRISAQTVYILALRSYLAAVCETDAVTHLITVARRATVVQKNAGGTMVNGTGIYSNIPGNTSANDALAIVFQSQRNAFNHCTMSWLETWDDIISKQYNIKPSILPKSFITANFTFQPYFSLEGSLSDCTFKRIKNGAAAMPVYISIMPYDASGDLWANYEYIEGYIKPESIEKYHIFMLKFLEAVVENPNKSVKELTEASI